MYKFSVWPRLITLALTLVITDIINRIVQQFYNSIIIHCFEENNPRATPLYGLYGDVPMVFDFSVLNRVLIVISRESVINRVLYSK